MCKVKRERLQHGQGTIGGDAARICVQDNEEEVGCHPSMGAAEQDAMATMSLRFAGEVELTAAVNEQRSALFLRLIGTLIPDIYHGFSRLDYQVKFES